MGNLSNSATNQFRIFNICSGEVFLFTKTGYKIGDSLEKVLESLSDYQYQIHNERHIWVNGIRFADGSVYDYCFVFIFDKLAAVHIAPSNRIITEKSTYDQFCDLRRALDACHDDHAIKRHEKQWLKAVFDEKYEALLTIDEELSAGITIKAYKLSII